MMKKAFVFALVALAILATGMGYRDPVIRLDIQWQDINGLEKGSAVYLDSRHVGEVESIIPDKDRTKNVRLAVAEKIQGSLTDKSRFYIVDDPNLQGKKAIKIEPGTEDGNLLTRGAVVQGSTKTRYFWENLNDNVHKGVGSFKQKMNHLADKFKNIPETPEYKSIKQQLIDIAKEIEKSGKKAGKHVRDDLIPKVEKELEVFKEKLRDMGKEDEARPLEERLERLRGV